MIRKALSVDLRDRVARYVLAGHSRREAAKVFGIGVSTAIRYGYQIHHIVEEQAGSTSDDANSNRFSDDQPNGPDNLVLVPIFGQTSWIGMHSMRLDRRPFVNSES